MTLAAGCGSGDDTGSGSEDDSGLTPVTVGLIPIVDVAPLYLGDSQGFFEDAGLDPTFEMAQGGAAIVAAVVSRDYDFGFSNIVSLMNAQSQGIELQVVAAGSSSTGEPGADFGSILVPEGSDIDSVDDLSGHTIAINALQSMNDPLIRDAVERAGGDPDTVEFVEIGHPEMNQALEQGQVDAIWQVEPFHTMALDAGMVSIYSLYAEATDDLSVAAYFASGTLLEDDPELAAAFREAVNRSFEYATDHPDEARTASTRPSTPTSRTGSFCRRGRPPSIATPSTSSPSSRSATVCSRRRTSTSIDCSPRTCSERPDRPSLPARPERGQ
jgi:NitT/TauT family transport system substrate-binding protein